MDQQLSNQKWGMIKIACSCIIGLLSAVDIGIAAAQDLGTPSEIHFLGQYSNISVSAESGDCDGFAIRLWSIPSKTTAESIVGTWAEADGPCDKSVPIFAVKFNAKTGALSFSTINASNYDGEPGQFQGRLDDSGLVGTFLWGGQPVGTPPVNIRLPRSKPGADFIQR